MIPVSENQVIYSGNGVNTAFSYSFKIIESTDLHLIRVAADGTETEVTSDYYVDMAASKVYYPGYAPGVEEAEADQPQVLQTGEKLVVYRNVPITQQDDMPDQWPFDVIESALDKSCIIDQQLKGEVDRSLKVSRKVNLSNFDASVPVPEDNSVHSLVLDKEGFKLFSNPGDAANYAAAAQNAASVAQSIVEEAGHDNYVNATKVLGRMTEAEQNAINNAEITRGYAQSASENAISAASSAASAIDVFNNLTTITTDTGGYAQQIVNNSNDIAIIKKDMYELGTLNILKQIGNFTNGTSAGITYTWSADKETCTLSGNATAQSTNVIVSSSASLPSYFVKGNEYEVEVNTNTGVYLSFYTYINGTGTKNIIKKKGIITIPSNCTGVLIRLEGLSGANGNGTLKVKVLSKNNLFVENTIKEDNSYNILKKIGAYEDVSSSSSAPSYGATLIWSNNVCTVNGTPTGVCYSNIYNQAKYLPVEKGKEYYVDVVSSDKTKLFASIWWYRNGTLSTTDAVYITSSKWVTIPTDADISGILIRVQGVANETYSNDTISVKIYAAYPNSLLTEFAKQNVIVLAGILPSMDINDLDDNVCCLLANTGTYENAPFALGTIYNLKYSSILSIQYGFQFTTGAIWYRRKSTTWGSWICLTDGHSGGYTNTKNYVAFGDSLTQGAVWNAVNDGSNYHYVQDEWKIPTRIAKAISMSDVLVNAGVSGIGYITKKDNQNIVDKVKAYNFSNTQLVTIMAGANDKATYSLGTHSSVADDGTICGAVKSIIDYMKVNYPKVQLVIIQPTPSLIAPPNNVWSTRGGGGWSMNDFDTEVSQLCYDNHIGYVNWWECTYCNSWNTINIGYSGNVGPNYTHPTTDEDYMLIGDFIAGKINALFR